MVQPEIHTRVAQPYAAIAADVSMIKMVTMLPQWWSEVSAWLAQHDVAVAGAPFIRYRRINMPDDMGLEVGIPTPTLAEGDERIICGEFPSGEYVEAVHFGAFDGLAASTAQLLEWGAERGLSWDMHTQGSQELWSSRLESYLTDPSSEPDPARWQTRIALKLITAGN